MDQSTRTDLERILSFYKGNELKEKPKDVGNGFWKPTTLPVLAGEIIAVDRWCAQEGKKHEGKVLVAGSGDGRRAVLLNRLGYDVFAVELNPRLFEHEAYLFDLLAKEGLVDRNRIRMVQGDFLDAHLYRSNGIRFGDFPKIFTYLVNGNFNPLVVKIEQQAQKGAELFALRHIDWADPKTSLKPAGYGTIRADGHTWFYISRYRKQ